MRNLTRNKWFYIICFIAFLGGICVGLPFNIDGFTFSWKVELFDIVTLMATIILAIYVATSLESKVQDDRIEKELHIVQISQIETLLDEIEHLLRSEQIIYKDVIYRISTIRKKKNNIFSSINEEGNTNNKIPQENTAKISSAIDNLKRLLTDTSVDNASEVTMRDGILSYSSERLSKINHEIDTLENDLFRLKIIINRS